MKYDNLKEKYIGSDSIRYLEGFGFNIDFDIYLFYNILGSLFNFSGFKVFIFKMEIKMYKIYKIIMIILED